MLPKLTTGGGGGATPTKVGGGGGAAASSLSSLSPSKNLLGRSPSSSSNTSTKRNSSKVPDPEPEGPMSPRQLTIARQLIQETFKDIIGYQSSRASKNEPKGDLMSAEEAKMENLRAERTRRTLKLIADPNYTDLYTMESERHLMTDYMLNEVIKNMIKQSSAQTSSVKIVATTLRQCLKVNIITLNSFLYSF